MIAPELAAIEPELAPGGLVVFGELHGTHEAPAFLALAAEHAATRGAVGVALELPDDLQAAIDAFLDTGDREALVATPSPFWEFRDGRGGDALLALLGRLHALRARGRDVAVVCFDGVWDVDDRDAGMARAILAGVARRPAAAWLVLCGNAHAMSHDPRWMGWHLRARHPALVALNIHHDGGAAWVITGDDHREGVAQLGTPTGDARRGVERFAARDARGFDGVFRVGPVTASLPITRDT